MFTVSGHAAAGRSDLFSAEMIAINRLDVCWTIFDSTALLPSSATTGWTVLVQPGAAAPCAQPVTSRTRQGLNCYQLNFAGGRSPLVPNRWWCAMPLAILLRVDRDACRDRL